MPIPDQNVGAWLAGYTRSARRTRATCNRARWSRARTGRVVAAQRILARAWSGQLLLNESCRRKRVGLVGAVCHRGEVNPADDAEHDAGSRGTPVGGEHGGYVPVAQAGESSAYRSSLTITLDDGTVLSPAEVVEFLRAQRPGERGADTGWVDLVFPADRVVGVLDWAGSWDPQSGPVLATGVVRVPGDGAVQLTVSAISRAEPWGSGWQLINEPGNPAVDVSFLRHLPAAIIGALSLGRVDAASFTAVRHLAAGLRRLTLAWSDLDDEVLPDIAALTWLTWLQTFGNRFTSAGVAQLAALTQLRDLYLEEETLTSSAFTFAAQLPELQRLGLQDVPLTAEDLAELRRRLPDVDVR